MHTARIAAAGMWVLIVNEETVSMMLICSYCGAESGDHDRSGGRCGKCGRFFTGNEEVVDESVMQEPVATGKDPDAVDDEVVAGRSAPVADLSDGPDEPHSFDDGLGADDVPEAADSEELVRPRRLSPQFKRRVEMTWQPSLAKDGRGAERTLSTVSSSEGTKHDHSSLSIGTRQIKPVSDHGSGDYELNDVIGEGSMGRVWSARQTSLDRNVAVKVPRPELANAGSVGESQFISEVVVTGKLEHPNIVPIYELGRDTQGIPFYSMKHVQGRPWNEVIEEKSEQENIEILMKVCDAIAFAHDRDFLHRDIKPHNVIVGEFGEVSVMDWGIAVSLSKDPDRGWAVTASGPAGTPAYMAPEMAAYNPSELGVVSDVYLLGAVLYQIVTGTPPHPRIGDTNEALLAAAANEIIPTTKNGELVDIARRAMATDVNDRYQNVKAFQDALREYQSHRESISLGESADEHLLKARKEGSSDEFARARFAYEEALKLWPGNSHAEARLRTATLAHAQNALQQENFELGISMLDPGEPGHRELLSRLENKRAARRRLASFARIAGGTAIAAILAVVVVTRYQKSVADEARDRAVESQKVAKRQTLAAEKARQTAKAAEEAAVVSRIAAEQSKDAALVAKQLAWEAEAATRDEKRRTEEASYASDIGLAAESIRRNLFPKARNILAELGSNLDSDSIRSKLRHIEWGLLQYAASPSVEDLLSDQRIEAVAASQDGRVIAAGREDGRVALMLPSDIVGAAAEVLEFRHGTAVHSLAISDGGELLATAGVDDTADDLAAKYAVKIWRVGNGKPERPETSLQGHTADVLSVAFSSDGQRVLTSAADRTAVVWDRSSGQPITIIPDHLEKRVWSARFSPSEREVVTACDDGRVRVWQIINDSKEPKKIDDFRGHQGPVYAAVFTPDGRYVVSGGYDRKLRRWPLGQASRQSDGGGKELGALLEGSPVDGKLIGTENEQHEASVRAIAIGSVGDQHFLLTGGNDNTLRVWQPSASDDWSLDKVLRGHGRWVRDCTFSDMGITVLSAANDGLKRWSWQNYQMPRELYPNSEVRVGSEPSESGSSSASKAMYSPDGRWVATSYQNGTVAIWDMRSGDQTASQLLVDGHAFLTAAGIFYDRGNRLLTSAGDNTTRLWDVSRGTQIRKLEGTGWRGAAAISFRADEAAALIVTGSDDRLVPARLWRVKEGESITAEPLLEDYAQSFLNQLPAYEAGTQSTAAGPTTFITKQTTDESLNRRRLQRKIPDVTAVAFSASGDRLLIGNSGGTCFLYHVESGAGTLRQVSTFQAHGLAVRTAAFLPAGDAFITASTDGELKQWESSGGKLQRQLPWIAPVTSLAVSEGGDRLLVGYAPVEGKASPVARVLNLTDEQVRVEAELRSRDREGTRDWQDNQPVVQSVRFAQSSDRALVSLFFPTRRRESQKAQTGAARRTGYELGYWDFGNEANDFLRVSTPEKGEISLATIREENGGAELLVAGGKGAKLFARDAASDDDFSKLSASFRPAAAITTIDFSADPVTGKSNRLVAGDADGNIRIWELVEDRWTESSGAAAQLTGAHDVPIITAMFHPLRPDQLLTADQTGGWGLWAYDQQWELKQQYKEESGSRNTNCALLSPDGNRIFMGGVERSQLWRRNDQGRYELDQRGPQMGQVRAATFSHDGGWLVTASVDPVGAESVDFWDSQGDRVRILSGGDSEAVTAMALSWDGRRFLTSYQKNNRVVVWDTSQLVDDIAFDRNASEKTKELLTLEEHRRGVNSVAISPNGRHLLTAGEEGRTIIWAGAAVAPISLALSRTQLSLKPDTVKLRIAEEAVVYDPSRLADLSGATLSVELNGVSVSNQRLTIDPSAPSTGAVVTLDPDGQTVSYLAHAQAQPRTIGALTTSSSSESFAVHITLNQAADAVVVQALIRALTYEVAKDDVHLARAVSGAQPPSPDVSGGSGNQEKVTITLQDIQYRDDSGDASLGENFPRTLQAEIVIDIEKDNVTSDDPSPALDSVAGGRR